MGGGPRREDEIIERDPPIIGCHLPCPQIDPTDPGQDEVHVRKAPEDPPHGICAIFRSQPRRGYLVEQRQEQVVVPPVEEQDIHGASGQFPRRPQPSESRAHDHRSRPPPVWFFLPAPPPLSSPPRPPPG